MNELEPLEQEVVKQLTTEIDNILEKFAAVIKPIPNILPDGRISAGMFVFKKPKNYGAGTEEKSVQADSETV